MHKGLHFAKFTAAARRSEFRKNLREIPAWGNPGVSYGAVALAVSAGDSDVYSEMFVVRVMTKEYAINAAAVIQVDLNGVAI